MAKKQVLKKEDAYSLASDTGVHLSEHGGTGQGVIGALAGAGLRLGGNDGRLRGRLDAEQLGNPVEVKKLLSHEYIDGVEDLSGNSLNEGELVYIEDKVKTVLRGGRFVLLVTPLNPPKSGAAWKNCSKQRLKEF
jgi:hypothetical protein